MEIGGVLAGTAPSYSEDLLCGQRIIHHFSAFFFFCQKGGKNKLKYSRSCKAQTSLVKKVVNKLLDLNKVWPNKNVQPGFKC